MAKPLLGATTLPANLLKQLFDTEYCHLLSISDLALVYRIREGGSHNEHRGKQKDS